MLILKITRAVPVVMMVVVMVIRMMMGMMVMAVCYVVVDSLCFFSNLAIRFCGFVWDLHGSELR